jgi:hypothetical protein
MGKLISERDKLLLALLLRWECFGLKNKLGKEYSFEKGKSTRKIIGGFSRVLKRAV